MHHKTLKSLRTSMRALAVTMGHMTGLMRAQSGVGGYGTGPMRGQAGAGVHRSGLMDQTRVGRGVSSPGVRHHSICKM